MIVVLGASGYVGQAFAAALQARGAAFQTVSRSKVDYTQFSVLRRFLAETRPAFRIHAAGFTGKPNVDACETARAETLLGNSLLPQTIVHACEVTGVPWGHISSGCIYNGAKVRDGGTTAILADLTSPQAEELLARAPEKITGFTEGDEPNFSFRQPPCSFYSGTKALGEEALARATNGYIWRLRIPFDERDNPRNYLTKLQRYPKVYNNVNSLSHRGDYAQACLDTWEKRVPWGTYNVTNPGHVSARQVIGLIEKHLQPARKFEFWANDKEFYRVAARTPRSNCILDVSKLLAAGIKMRPVEEALNHALTNWRPA